jgi:hypothetical protein
LLAPLIFFSFSSSKLPGYILPVLPAVSLLAGARFCGLLSAKESTRDLPAASGILLVAAIAGFIFVTTRGMLSIKCAGLILAPLILASSFALVSREIRLTALALSISVPLSFLLALKCEIPKLALAHSSRHLIEIANARGFGTAPIYALHEVDRGLEYYGAGRVVYGEDGEPLKFEGTAELVKIAQSRDTAILVVVPLKYAYQLLGADGVIAEVVADNGDMGIVAVRRRG